MTDPRCARCGHVQAEHIKARSSHNEFSYLCPTATWQAQEVTVTSRAKEHSTEPELSLIGRIVQWREDDSKGAGSDAIELICESEDELRRLVGERNAAQRQLAAAEAERDRALAVFCEAHQELWKSCPCCEAVHADDERKVAEAALTAARQAQATLRERCAVLIRAWNKWVNRADLGDWRQRDELLIAVKVYVEALAAADAPEAEK
jgi:hypothetical protein